MDHFIPLPHHMTISELRKDIASAADRVIRDGVPILVTRGNKEPVAMIPYALLSGLQETLAVLSDSRKSGALTKAIADLDAGKGTRHSMESFNALFSQLPAESPTA